MERQGNREAEVEVEEEEEEQDSRSGGRLLPMEGRTTIGAHELVVIIVSSGNTAECMSNGLDMRISGKHWTNSFMLLAAVEN